MDNYATVPGEMWNNWTLMNILSFTTLTNCYKCAGSLAFMGRAINSGLCCCGDVPLASLSSRGFAYFVLLLLLLRLLCLLFRLPLLLRWRLRVLLLFLLFILSFSFFLLFCVFFFFFLSVFLLCHPFSSSGPFLFFLLCISLSISFSKTYFPYATFN